MLLITRSRFYYYLVPTAFLMTKVIFKLYTLRATALEHIFTIFLTTI